jgi:hypothetical protein
MGMAALLGRIYFSESTKVNQLKSADADQGESE